jgi:hypothetical protein
MPHGAYKKRHDPERRHPDPHFRDGKESSIGCERNVAAGDEGRAAADGAALHRRDRRLRQRIERDQHVAQRQGRLGRLSGSRVRIFGTRRKIGAGTEMAAAAAQDDYPHALVGSERGELLGQLIEHALVEGIAAIRPVEQHRRHGPRRDLDRNRLQRHRKSSLTITCRIFDSRLLNRWGEIRPLLDPEGTNVAYRSRKPRQSLQRHNRLE